MNRIRLLPIVVFAAFARLLLKGFGLVAEGGYVLLGVDGAQAQSTNATDAGQSGTPAPLSARDTAAADRASESLFSRAEAAPVNSSQLDALPYKENKAGEKVPIGSSDGVSDTERAVLERLSDRRSELDQLEVDLAARQTLVEAAESRLAERVAGLQGLEARINALVEEKKNIDNEQFAGLVSMYEAMKPKDAANIFNQLSTDVLLRVARAMNPRKMSPVLAAMNPTRAQELTVLLAAEGTEPQLDTPLDNLNALPQIVGK